MEFHIGQVKVVAKFANHPGICAAYRLFTSGGSITYMPDNEPYERLKLQLAAQDGIDGNEALNFAGAERTKMVEFLRDCEVAILDSQYTDEEYQGHIGWGHSSLSSAVLLALDANVKRVLLFHHDPSHVRGAGLIGASAAYGMYLAAIEAAKNPTAAGFDEYLTDAAARLKATRPTAVNLTWAIDQVRAGLAVTSPLTAREKIERARRTAEQIADQDAEHCRMIGQHGLNLIKQIAQTKEGKFATANPSCGGPVNVLTHCNAGWLAFVDYGSALAPIYAAHAVIPIMPVRMVMSATGRNLLE